MWAMNYHTCEVLAVILSQQFRPGMVSTNHPGYVVIPGDGLRRTTRLSPGRPGGVDVSSAVILNYNKQFKMFGPACGFRPLPSRVFA